MAYVFRRPWFPRHRIVYRFSTNAGSFEADGSATVSFAGAAQDAATWNADGSAAVIFESFHKFNADGVATANFAGLTSRLGVLNADGSAGVAWTGAYTSYPWATWNADGAASISITGASKAAATWNANGSAAVSWPGYATTAPFKADGVAAVTFIGRLSNVGLLNADGSASVAFTGLTGAKSIWNADGTSSVAISSGAPHPFNADGTSTATFTGRATFSSKWNANGTSDPTIFTASTAGPFYFAWINPGEVWGPMHLRQDEIIFSFDLEHEEGQCATLAIEVKNPFSGFLAPGRKQWCFFSLHSYPIFQGRLISTPADITGEVVTLHFTAMPTDMIDQQRTIADMMMTLPEWDPVFIEEGKRLDPNSIFEGRSAIWCVDRATLQVTVEDLLVGSQGIVQFGDGTANDVFYDSVQPSIDHPPLRSVLVDATVGWTQFDTNTIDMGAKTWDANQAAGLIGSWPKAGTSIGSGWSVAHSLALDLTGPIVSGTYRFQFINGDMTHNFGDTLTADASLTVPHWGTAQLDIPITQDFSQLQALPFGQGRFFLTSEQLSIVPGDEETGVAAAGNGSQAGMFVFDWNVSTRLVLRYEAERERTERMRFLLTADLQPVFTDSGNLAADFAQDSELIDLQGKVGLEGPFGTYRGDFVGGLHYNIYDIFTVTVNGETNAFQVTRDHESLATFDPGATAGQVEDGAWLDAGVNVFANGLFWSILISGIYHASQFVGTGAIDGTSGTLFFVEQPNPHAGPSLYKGVPSFRGNWKPNGEVLVAGDMVIAPDGTWYRVAVGHQTAANFYRFQSDITGRLFYELMLNPPPIGDVSRRSYLPTVRGNQSIEHMVLRARAHIISRSRVFKIIFECRFEPVAANANLLRCNVHLFDRRLPGGAAIGKVISYGIKGNGDQGTIIGTVTIGCAVGLGGSVVPAIGQPMWASLDYVDASYDQVSSAFSVLSTNDVAYTPPADVGVTIDDGLVFPLKKSDVKSESTIVFTLPIEGATGRATSAAARDQYFANQLALMELQQAISKTQTNYQIVLPPVQNGPFAAEYDLTTTTLQVPKQIDLYVSETAAFLQADGGATVSFASH